MSSLANNKQRSGFKVAAIAAGTIAGMIVLIPVVPVGCVALAGAKAWRKLSHRSRTSEKAVDVARMLAAAPGYLLFHDVDFTIP